MSEVIRLRELERKDIPAINRWRNDPELISSLGAPFRYIGHEIDEAWFDSYLKSRSCTVRCSVVNENDVILGLVSLVAIDPIHKTAELHIMIGDAENRGKGIGSFAVKEMLHHGFMNMNLNRIELEVFDDNTSAIALYEKNGFVLEGKKRQAAFKEGKYRDVLIYSILREDHEKSACSV